MVSVLSREPDWNALPAATPARVRGLCGAVCARTPRSASTTPPTHAWRSRNRRRSGGHVLSRASGSIQADARVDRHRDRGRRDRRARGLAHDASGRGAPSSDPVISKLARITHDAGRLPMACLVARRNAARLCVGSRRQLRHLCSARGGRPGRRRHERPRARHSADVFAGRQFDRIRFDPLVAQRSHPHRRHAGEQRPHVRGGPLGRAGARRAARRLASDANSPSWRPDGKGIVYITGSETHPHGHGGPGGRRCAAPAARRR